MAYTGVLRGSLGKSFPISDPQARLVASSGIFHLKENDDVKDRYPFSH
jgi:hypothetical protein